MNRASLPILILAALLGRGAGAVPTLHPNPLADVQTLFETEKYDEVVSRLQGQNIESFSQQYQAQAYLLLGLSYIRQNKIDKALGVLQLAAQLFPNDINVLSALADLLHHEELDDRAKPLYEKVLNIHPNNGTAHLALAEIERSQGFLERSIDHYERCLAELPNDAPIWRAYAIVLSERLEYAKATVAIKKSLSLDPGNSQALESLAIFQYRQGLYQEAERTIRNAIAVSKNKTQLRLEHALWLLKENDLNGSIGETQLALESSPGNPLGLWIRASISIRRGKNEAAIADLKLAAANDTQYPFIASIAQEMLGQMEARP